MEKSSFKFSALSQTAGVLLALSANTQAIVLKFDTDPFAGTTALTTPGRQIVGNELFTNFDVGADVITFDSKVFKIGNTINFANDVAGNLPTGGANVVVLQSFDNDGNPGTPFGAGNAANLIANQVTSPGAGFFIYFNSNFDLARLVYSTDLSDNTADLKIVARFLNLSGQGGRDAFPTITSANFSTVPDAGHSLGLLSLAGSALLFASRRTLHRSQAQA